MDLVPWIGGLCAVAAVGLLLVVAAPWRRRRDAALDDEVQARLLLGEDPEEIERDLEARREGSASVAELRRDE